MIIEDADRLTDQACNALLKAIEEPTARTVWMLCAPTAEDVLPTIRSRCRLVTLTTPPRPTWRPSSSEREGVAAPLAAHAARASQGHIGRARALAQDEATRNRRNEVVRCPARLTTLGGCMTAATNLLDLAKEEAEAIPSGSTPGRRPTSTALRGRGRGKVPGSTHRRSGPRAGPEDPREAPGARRGRPGADGPGLGLPRRDRDVGRRPGVAGQRGDPRRRRPAGTQVHPRGPPAPHRRRLHRPRADAGVQRPAPAGDGVDDGRAAPGARRAA